MSNRNLMEGLEYRGEAKGKRQTYYVFEGKRRFLVVSFSGSKRQAGNFNIVDPDAVEYVAHRFTGRQGVTSKEVAAQLKKARHVWSELGALNVLYVLVATGHAKVDTRRKSRQLFFNLKRDRGSR